MCPGDDNMRRDVEDGMALVSSKAVDKFIMLKSVWKL
jgi:hypothetical protein